MIKAKSVPVMYPLLKKIILINLKKLFSYYFSYFLIKFYYFYLFLLFIMSENIKNSKVIWARLGNYAPWPSRVCCTQEEKELISIRKNLKTTDLPVLFFGSKKEK